MTNVQEIISSKQLVAFVKANQSEGRNSLTWKIYDFLRDEMKVEVSGKIYRRVARAFIESVSDHGSTVHRTFEMWANGGEKPKEEKPEEKKSEEKPKEKKEEKKSEEKSKTKKGNKVIRHECFDKMLKYVSNNIPVYLTGPAGTGKSELCRQLAEELNLKFYLETSVLDKYALTGFVDANGNYQETEFFRAWTKGGIFLLDEADSSAPEALVAINNALANGFFTFPKHGRINAHKDFHCMAAGNTIGKGADDMYTGRAPMDESFLDRFAMQKVDYDKRVELAIAKGNKEIVDFIHDLRKASEGAGMRFTISYRAISRLVKFEQLVSLEEAVQDAIVRGLDEDNLEILKGSLKSGNKYADAFKLAKAI